MIILLILSSFCIQGQLFGAINDREFDQEKLETYKKSGRYDYDDIGYNSSEEILESRTDEDGTVIQKMADGSIVKKYKDGKTVTERSDGVIITKDADGTLTVEKEDGTIFKKYRDGRKEMTDPDGTTYSQESDDDPIIVKKTDGTIEKKDGQLTPDHSSSINIGGLGNSILIILGVLIVGLTTYLILNNINSQAKVKISNDKIEDLPEEQENIHEIDFNQVLEDLINKEEYRRAVRYLFLQLLKQLSDKNSINWKIDKTNKEYYYEISNPTIAEEFQKLWMVYDYVWYGKSVINRAQFDEVRQNFLSFSKLLKQ